MPWAWVAVPGNPPDLPVQPTPVGAEFPCCVTPQRMSFLKVRVRSATPFAGLKPRVLPEHGGAAMPTDQKATAMEKPGRCSSGLARGVTAAGAGHRVVLVVWCLSPGDGAGGQRTSVRKLQRRWVWARMSRFDMGVSPGRATASPLSGTGCPGRGRPSRVRKALDVEASEIQETKDTVNALAKPLCHSCRTLQGGSPCPCHAAAS